MSDTSMSSQAAKSCCMVFVSGRAILAASAVHRAAGFERAGAALGVGHPGGVLGLLAELTRALLALGGGGDDWKGEGRSPAHPS